MGRNKQKGHETKSVICDLCNRPKSRALIKFHKTKCAASHAAPGPGLLPPAPPGPLHLAPAPLHPAPAPPAPLNLAPKAPSEASGQPAP